MLVFRGFGGKCSKRLLCTLATDGKTHFGFQDVNPSEKEFLVGEVFHKVADKYDLMNDFMSGSLHRTWKDHFVQSLCPITSDDYLAKHIDVAGGTGDIAFRILKASNKQFPKSALGMTVYDINHKMLEVGKSRAKEQGLWASDGTGNQMEWRQGNAESLPYGDETFDSYSIAFGIRNCTNVSTVLSEAYRVLKPGGRFMCLEFSHLANPLLQQMYDTYSFNVIPELGQLVAGDRESYQYLVESIRKFPTQRVFERMIRQVGFDLVKHEDLTHGVVAIHSAYKWPS